MSPSKAHIVGQLKNELVRLQGYRALQHNMTDIGLGPMRFAFPDNSFPIGCIHEFLSSQIEHQTASSAFIAGLLSSLMGDHGITLWISASRKLFPPALKTFGLEPDRFIFIDVQKEKDVLWTMEESLKCSAVTTVVAEMREIDFTASRRLQLAVEQSHVTGFLLRHEYKNVGTTASVAKWKITPLPSDSIDGLPGIGFPKWRIELLRIRNGKPGTWDLEWVNRKFRFIQKTYQSIIQEKKAG